MKNHLNSNNNECNSSHGTTINYDGNPRSTEVCTCCMCHQITYGDQTSYSTTSKLSSFISVHQHFCNLLSYLIYLTLIFYDIHILHSNIFFVIYKCYFPSWTNKLVFLFLFAPSICLIIVLNYHFFLIVKNLNRIPK